MTIEAHIPASVDSPTPTERVTRFDYQTAFVSSLDGIRMHQDYQTLIEMGQEAIPIVINALQEKPTWTALALNELTGKDVVGLNLDSTKALGITIEQIRERSLNWAEQNGLIEIRDKGDLQTKALELSDGLYETFVRGRPEVTAALADYMFRGDSLEPDSIRRIIAEFKRNGVPTRLIYKLTQKHIVHWGKLREVGSMVETEITTNRREETLASVSIVRYPDSIKNVNFFADGQNPNTQPGYAAIRDLIDNPGDITDYKAFVNFFPAYIGL